MTTIIPIMVANPLFFEVYSRLVVNVLRFVGSVCTCVYGPSPQSFWLIKCLYISSFFVLSRPQNVHRRFASNLPPHKLQVFMQSPSLVYLYSGIRQHTTRQMVLIDILPFSYIHDNQQVLFQEIPLRL